MSPDATVTSVAGFVLGELLGKGGFGAVYRSRHAALDVDVAVKLIDVQALATDPARVLAEARLMARLDHPNLLRVFDAGLSGPWVYLVLEYMDGGSLRGAPPFSPAAALETARQILSAVQALHDARVLHRDIKPGNVLRRASDGRLKLADLGIATEWRTAAEYDRAGTLSYMAPELFDGPPRYSPATDLYAVGVTLSVLIQPPGAPAAPAPPPEAAAKRPRACDARPDLPPVLAALIDRLCARDQAERPASAAEALAALTADAPVRAPAVPAAAHDTATQTSTPRGALQIGSWALGEVVHDSANWRGCVAYHARTGHAARLMWLKPDGPIGTTSHNILAAAERAAGITHPAISEVIDWGRHEGQAFVVTPAQGRSLRDVVDGGRPLDEPTALGFMASLADALAHLHALGLVYQLVEPGSVVLREDARSAQFGWPIFSALTGTPVAPVDGVSPRFYVPKFATPETLVGAAERIEPSADMYGLGVTFCYLLAGGEAYERGRTAGGAQLRAVVPELTARFASLIARLMALDPAARPTATEVRAELGTIARHLGVQLA
jgi:serine/threonine protein kinase